MEGLGYLFPAVHFIFIYFYFVGQRDTRKFRGSNHVKSKDPYNMEEIVMPLHEYIMDPVAYDIVHNGATFQVYFWFNPTACSTYIFPYIYFLLLLFCPTDLINRLQD